MFAEGNITVADKEQTCRWWRPIFNNIYLLLIGWDVKCGNNTILPVTYLLHNQNFTSYSTIPHVLFLVPSLLWCHTCFQSQTYHQPGDLTLHIYNTTSYFLHSWTSQTTIYKTILHTNSFPEVATMINLWWNAISDHMIHLIYFSRSHAKDNGMPDITLGPSHFFLIFATSRNNSHSYGSLCLPRTQTSSFSGLLEHIQDLLKSKHVLLNTWNELKTTGLASKRQHFFSNSLFTVLYVNLFQVTRIKPTIVHKNTLVR